MAIETHLHDGTAARKLTELHLHDGTAARKLKELWFHDGTSARKIFSGVGVPALSNRSLSGLSASVQFKNDGTLHAIDDAGDVTVSGQWLTSSPTPVTSVEAGAWSVRFTYVSGPHDTAGTTNGGKTSKGGAAYDVDLPLSTTQTINFTGQTGLISGSYGGQLVFDAVITLAGGGSTIASCRFTLNIASS